MFVIKDVPPSFKSSKSFAFISHTFLRLLAQREQILCHMTLLVGVFERCNPSSGAQLLCVQALAVKYSNVSARRDCVKQSRCKSDSLNLIKLWEMLL